MFDDLHTRRLFISRGMTVLSAATTLPAFLESTGRALANTRDASTGKTRKSDHRIFVVVQLGGGNDGLSTVIPVDNDDYRRARPRLAINRNLLSLGRGSGLALHPNMTGMKSLFDAGHLSVVLGAGYPNPNRSHFRSMAIWQTAQPAIEANHGWLGRYFDNQCCGADPVTPEAAVNVGPTSPMALHGKEFSSVSFMNPAAFQWLPGSRKTLFSRRMHSIYDELNGISGHPEAVLAGQDSLNFLQRVALDAHLAGADIRHATDDFHNAVPYPDSDLGRSLANVAKMIHADLPTTVYYVSMGGFDTHANEKSRHDKLMKDLSDALTSFINDLKAQGNLDRTLVMTFSEFGRRVAENASGGTDHGTAAPMFLMGGSIRPGLLGVEPSLSPAHLDHGDLRFTVDFRTVYASVLKDWLHTDAQAILNGRFKTLPILAGRS